MREHESSDFLRQREQQERELAQAAVDVAVRNIHIELATSYAERARAAELKLGHEERRSPE